MRIETKQVYKHTGVLTEYERGWGSKRFVAKHFETKHQALDWVAEKNKHNTAAHAPDYYIQADYEEEMSKQTFDSINS